jgi:hypothetical protein
MLKAIMPLYEFLSIPSLELNREFVHIIKLRRRVNFIIPTPTLFTTCCIPFKIEG